MDAFIASSTWHYFAFLKTSNGDVWRVWFDGRQGPLMEKLTSWQIEGYKEAIKELK